ncbi:hypothetical protein MUA02_03395 [Enterobacteriaceae bacterium H20N1]|uniref:Uncharacterized protein n=1 Tax=Dryocola boscaweniae TaxID=2925397 RepID=A0A9X3AMB7_9ENTR|nr:hypothetical protein [Dryocola boscaweniae]MCT4701047.1 hypothetical protein [Dryocola boscaweniae]MCT4714565.1 hypothetical protein [Dryocola boscaweniae]MCT4718091.1 hypothetical protein [Dryocola boscaweniae]
MRNLFKLLAAAVVLITVALAWAWPYIKMEFAGSAHYTEQDRREYEFYTPVILKKMPRISPRYDFDFANITGPASHVYAVKYYDTHDSRKVNAYLSSLGYKKQKECHIEAVCWLGTDPQEIVTVSFLEHPKTLLVSIIYNL